MFWAITLDFGHFHLGVRRCQFNSPPKNGWAETATDLLAAEGATNENPAVNYIIHHVGEELPANERSTTGRFDMVPVTSRTTKLFLGVRIQCAAGGTAAEFVVKRAPDEGHATLTAIVGGERRVERVVPLPPRPVRELLGEELAIAGSDDVYEAALAALMGLA